MMPKLQIETPSPDAAAVFACALSLWQACQQPPAPKAAWNLSATYNGMDQLMREVMRVGNLFEEWACLHIAFDQLTEVWPYKLENDFGPTCLTILAPSTL